LRLQQRIAASNRATEILRRRLGTTCRCVLVTNAPSSLRASQYGAIEVLTGRGTLMTLTPRAADAVRRVNIADRFFIRAFPPIRS
jgi:hypothetical protein